MAEAAEDYRAERAEDARRKRLEYQSKKAAAQAERPPLKDASTCADFAALNVNLQPAHSAFPGPFRPWRHQIAWLNLPFAENGPKSITIRKCARAGYSKCILAAAAWGALNGKNSLIVTPRHTDTLSFSAELRPVLDELFGTEAHAGTWTKTEMEIRPRAYGPSQSIRLLAGQVSDELKKWQANAAYVDEADSLRLDVQGDGGVLQRLETRLRESQGVLMAGSTPTRRGSLLDIAMAESDLTFDWTWACPSCGHWQAFDFEKLTGGARLPCSECGELHVEADIRKTPQRWQALDGRFILDDGVTLSEGSWEFSCSMRINALAIPVLPWAGLIRADRRAKTPEARKVVRNEILGLPWGASGRAIGIGELMDQRQKLTANPERCRTVGADVQRDRIEAICTETDADERVYILDYAIVEGETAQPGKGAWQGLAVLIDKWAAEHGGIAGGAIDCGYRGDGAYAFKRRGFRAIKGSQPLSTGGMYRISRQRDRGVDCILADTGMVKSILFDRLSDERQRWFYFNQELEEPVLQGLFLSEELRIVDGANKWVRLGPNHALDSLVYAFTAQRFVRERLHWKQGAHLIRKPRRFVAHRAGLR